MNIEIESAIKHVRAYWFIDGFTEMATGVFFILLAGLLLFSGSASPDTFTLWFLSMAGEISIVKITGILMAILILWWLKNHFTYPRTGFVRGKRVTTAQILMVIRNIVLFLLVPILGLLVASLLTVPAGKVLNSMPIWLPVGISLVWASLIAIAGEWMGLRRFRIVGGLILLAGIAIGTWQFLMGMPASPIGFKTGNLQPLLVDSLSRTLASLEFLVLISGIILILSGLITFLRYRKENPQPYSEDV